MKLLYETEDVKNKSFFSSRKGKVNDSNWREQSRKVANDLVSFGEALSATRGAKAGRMVSNFVVNTIPARYDELTREGDQLKTNPVRAEKWMNEVKLFRDGVLNENFYSYAVFKDFMSRVESFFKQIRSVWEGPYGIRATMIDKPRKRFLNSYMHSLDVSKVNAKAFNIDLDAMPGTQRKKFIELLSRKDRNVLKAHEVPLELRRALDRANKLGSVIILTSNSPQSRAICEANAKKFTGKVCINANHGSFVAVPNESGKLKVLRDESVKQDLIVNLLDMLFDEHDEDNVKSLLRECEIPFKLTKNNGQIQQIQAKITWEASLVDKSGVEHILPLTASKEEYEKFIQEQKDCKSFSFHPILKNIKDLVACKGAPLWESELDDLKYDLSAYGVAILSAVMASQGENKDLIDAHLQLNSNGSVSVLPPEVSSISGCKSILSYYNKTEEDLFSLIGSQEALSTPINLVAEGEVFNHHRQHKNKSLRQLALDMERWEAIHHVNMAALNLITKETSTENNKRQIIDNKRVLLCGKCGVVKKKVGRSVWKKIFADNGTKMRKPLEKWAGESFKSRNNVVKDGINFVGKSLTR